MPKTLSRRRVTYDREFKLKVVREALKRPVGRRIRPTCSNYPSVEPCQLRKWIRALQYEAERGDRGSSCDSEPEDDSLPPLHAGVSFEAALPPDVEEEEYSYKKAPAYPRDDYTADMDMDMSDDESAYAKI